MTWLALSSGDVAGWSGGRLSWPSDGPEDPPFLQCRSEGCTRPEWASALVERIDAALPARSVMEAALEDGSLTVDPHAAAFRIPASPDASGAGTCLLAARILLAFRDELLPPVFSTDDECVEWLERASTAALIVGGKAAWLCAAAAAADPATWSPRTPPASGLSIEIGEAR